jgi:hypothetical protein
MSKLLAIVTSLKAILIAASVAFARGERAPGHPDLGLVQPRSARR